MKLLFALIALSPLMIHAQGNNDCSQLKEVTLYAYPRNSTDQFKIIRSGNKQVEYNLKTGDSTEYKIKWDKNCQYTLTYVSSSEKKSATELENLARFKFAYDILSVSPSYYVYNIYLDKVVNSPREHWQISTDTAWLKPITTPSNSVLFAPLKEKASHLKRHFNDTSSYAIVYLYRPSKVWGMMASYYVYLDQDFIYPATNSSKVAYKVFKEGPQKIHAKIQNVEATVPVDIKFGKKYYVECLLDNSPPKSKPVLKVKDQENGQLDYDSL